MFAKKGNVHVVMIHLEDEDKLERAVRNGHGIDAVCGYLHHFQVVTVVPKGTNICPECQAALDHFEQEHGYRYRKHFVSETIKLSPVVQPNQSLCPSL